MLEIPTTEPTRITAGDTVRWHKVLPGYAPTEWSLEYLFACASAVKTVHAEVADSGQGYVVRIAASESAQWPAGPYTWRARVRKDAGDSEEIYTVAEGLCTVTAALTAGVDLRSAARRALDEIKAYLADPHSIACQSYTIKGRSVTQYSLPELWAHHDRLVQEVAREDARRAGKAPGGGRILVGFRR